MTDTEKEELRKELRIKGLTFERRVNEGIIVREEYDERLLNFVLTKIEEAIKKARKSFADEIRQCYSHCQEGATIESSVVTDSNTLHKIMALVMEVFDSNLTNNN